MDELHGVRNRLCSFLKGLTKLISKKKSSVQKQPRILFNIGRQSHKHVCADSAFCCLSSPASWKGVKETQRPRNVVLMWYRLALVVKLGRDKNNPQQEGIAVWTNPWGKNTLMTNSNYGYLVPSPKCVISWECLNTGANGQGTNGQFSEGKKACQNCHCFSCLCHPMICLSNS